MKILTMAAQKGGVGKSTLSANLAVAAHLAGLKVALLDLDRQETASAWADLRKEEEPWIEPMSLRRLEKALETALTNGFDLVILDTPPAACDEASEGMRLADLVLVPCRPSLPDLQAVKRTTTVLKSIGTPGYVVLNAAPPTATALIDDARTIAGRGDVGISPVVIRERSAFRAAWPYGQGVMEYEPEGKAAAEMAQLRAFVFTELQLYSAVVLQKKKGAKHG